MGFHNFQIILLFIFTLQLANNVHECLSFGSCDWYQGSWVFDNSLPLYTNKTCPFIRKFINCQGNGRPDTDYQKYRWQPIGCNLARLDGNDFLKRYRGKHIMFVGDSLSVDQFESLICSVYNSVPNLRYTQKVVGQISTWTLLDYDLEVSMDLNHFFVDILPTNKGWVLTLDSIGDGKHWLGVDTLIFNTWHWWFYKKPHQPWDLVKDGNNTVKDLDRMYIYKRALDTWAQWVDANINPNKTRVFFQGISPSHYRGAEWGEPNANCKNQKTPILGSTYPGPYPTGGLNIIKNRLKTMKTPVTLLDITGLSLLRKDGHPSAYGQGGLKGNDCTHWCLSGVPDAWNQILYNYVVTGEK